MGVQTIPQSQAEMFVIAFRAMPLETQRIILDELVGAPHTTDTAQAQHTRNEPALRLLRDWVADNSGYDERAWPTVRHALEVNRLSDRELFCG